MPEVRRGADDPAGGKGVSEPLLFGMAAGAVVGWLIAPVVTLAILTVMERRERRKRAALPPNSMEWYGNAIRGALDQALEVEAA